MTNAESKKIITTILTDAGFESFTKTLGMGFELRIRNPKTGAYEVRFYRNQNSAKCEADAIYFAERAERAGCKVHRINTMVIVTHNA